MANSSSGSTARKPRRDFPLWIHRGAGPTPDRWAKKVRGKTHYFGNVANDPEGKAALELWLEQRDDLLAGRTPRVKGDGLTVADMANRFLTAKAHSRDCGEITPRTWAEYKLTVDRVVEQFGRTRLVCDLASDDFEALRATFAKTRGPEALGNEVQRTRALFKYAYDAGLIEHPMRYGPQFKRPSKKVMRIARAKAGSKMFEAADVLALLAKAGPELRAMILLGVNCGFGNNDCATLPMSAVDLDRKVISFPRPKTGIDRRCVLWDETAAALAVVIAKRHEPKDPAHAGLLFVTKYGGSFAKATCDNPITKEFAKLLKTMGLTQTGRNFYALRHSFRTVADETRDFPAIDKVMGHSDASMADRYRERIDDSRLQAVVQHVHGWLWPQEQKPKPANPVPKRPAAKPKEVKTESPRLTVFAG